MQYDACSRVGLPSGRPSVIHYALDRASAVLCAGLRHTAARQRVTWFSSYNLRYDGMQCPVDVNLCFVFRVWEGGRRKGEGWGGEKEEGELEEEGGECMRSAFYSPHDYSFTSLLSLLLPLSYLLSLLFLLPSSSLSPPPPFPLPLPILSLLLPSSDAGFGKTS